MFNKNITALNKTNPILAQQLSNYSLDEAKKTIFVYQAESNDIIIALNNICLDDTVNPIESSKNIYDSLIKNKLNKNDTVIIFGLGTGYLFKRAYISTDARILVYEPSIEVIRFILEYIDFSNEIADSRIYFSNEINDCIKYLSQRYIVNDKIEIIYNNAYINNFSDKLLQLSENIIKICESKNSDINTIKLLSKYWTTNSLQNRKKLKNARPLNIYKDIFKDKTALILAAGPSLKDNISLIKENRDKFVVFAVNKISDYLHKMDIIPDFLVAADAAGIEYTLKTINETSAKINLITTTKADSFLLKHSFKSVIIYYLDNDAFNEALCKKFPDFLKSYPIDGTAVSQAYYSAKEMGFKNIIFCGLDLALKDNTAYADGEKAEINPKTQSAKFYVNNKNIVKVKSITGKDVYTRDDYAVFVNQLSMTFRENKKLNLFNVSDFGAVIEGMEYKSLSEILSKLDCLNCPVSNMLEQKNAEFEDIWQKIYNEQLNIYDREFENLNLFEPMISSFISKNYPARLDLLKNYDVEQLIKIKQDEIKIIKSVLDNLLLSYFFQPELLSYTEINNTNNDLSPETILQERIAAIELLDGIYKEFKNLKNFILLN